MNIPKQVGMAMSILEEKGFEVFAVGGCIRDVIMGKIPHDWDLCTSAEPEDIKSAFTGIRTIDTGIKHGTITVIIEDIAIEITTYRQDNGSSDHRHPDEVKFTKSLEEDLHRRDLTINALAYNPKIGLVDMHSGIADIKGKIIRTIGDPNKRFDEDALRVMRAVRFSAMLGFKIEEKTSKSINENISLLQYVSKERLSAELAKILLSPNAGILAKDYIAVLRRILPSGKNITASAQNELADCLNSSYKNLNVALSLIWYYIRPSNSFLRELKYSNEIANEVEKLCFYLTTPLKPTAFEIKRMLNVMGVDSFYSLLSLKRILCEHSGGYVSENAQKITQVISLTKEVINKGECYGRDKLEINGDDLIAIGYDGKAVGETLELMLQMVWSDNTLNCKDKLLLIAAQLKPKK